MRDLFMGILSLQYILEDHSILSMVMDRLIRQDIHLPFQAKISRGQRSIQLT